MNSIAFNAGFMREMYMIARLAQPLDEEVPGGQRRKAESLVAGSRQLSGATRELSRQRLHVHMVEAEAEMARLGAASKMDAEETSLDRLFELGRARARGFLAEHKDDIGVRSSLDVEAPFL